MGKEAELQSKKDQQSNSDMRHDASARDLYKVSKELNDARDKNQFNARKFKRFCNPPRWHMAERDF